MPQKNRIKTYVTGGYYHVYNRGVAKSKIFLEKLDYQKYLEYISEALLPPIVKKVEFTLKGQTFKGEPRPVKNFLNEIDLIVYCLMPNHFHFLLKQNEMNSMQEFIRSINTRYVTYFNKKYNRVGPLYEGCYKAVLIKRDEYLLYLSKYIHLNPKGLGIDLKKAYSSYADFLKMKNTKWLSPDKVLKFFEKKVKNEFKKINTYQAFVEGKHISEVKLPKNLYID